MKSQPKATKYKIYSEMQNDRLLSMLSHTHTHKVKKGDAVYYIKYMLIWRLAPVIPLNLVTIWSYVTSFMSRPVRTEQEAGWAPEPIRGTWENRIRETMYVERQ